MFPGQTSTSLCFDKLLRIRSHVFLEWTNLDFSAKADSEGYYSLNLSFVCKNLRVQFQEIVYFLLELILMLIDIMSVLRAELERALTPVQVRVLVGN